MNIRNWRASAPPYRHWQDDQDVNGDGKVDTAVVIQWNALSGAVRYDVEVSRWNPTTSAWVVTGLGGSAPVSGNSIENFTFKANTSRLYKVRVRGRNFAGVPGAWTTNVVLTTSNPFASYSGFQPAKKPSYTSSIQGDVNGLPLGIECFTAVFLRDDDYDHTEFYFSTTHSTPATNVPASAVLTAGSRVDVNCYSDLPAFAPGTVVYAWYRNADTSNNKTAWAECGSSPVTIQTLDGSAVTDASITYTKLSTAVFNNGNAALIAGDKGTTCWLKKTSAGTASPGDLVAGGNLVFSDSALGSGASPSGQWQCMGRCPSGQASDWLRTA